MSGAESREDEDAPFDYSPISLDQSGHVGNITADQMTIATVLTLVIIPVLYSFQRIAPIESDR